MDARGYLLIPAVALVSCAHSSTALRSPTASITAIDRQIRNATDAGDGDFLLRSLRQRMIEHPEDLSFRLELARAYESRRVPELALEHFRLAADRFPESAEAHLSLARSLHAARLDGDAVRTLGDFLQAHPQRSAVYASWLGILQDDAGDWKAGEAAHRQAIEIAVIEGQDKDYLHNNLGYCLLKQGRKSEAAAEFRSALALNRGSEISRNNLGIAIAEDPRAAILAWQSVSEPAAAHSNMAAMLIDAGKYPEARAEIARALGYNKGPFRRARKLEIGFGIGWQAINDSAYRIRTRMGTLEWGGKAMAHRAREARKYQPESNRIPITGVITMKNLLIRFLKEEDGQDLVEYALIVAAVGLALITTVNQLSSGIVSLYSSITGDLSSIGATAQ